MANIERVQPASLCGTLQAVLQEQSIGSVQLGKNELRIQTAQGETKVLKLKTKEQALDFLAACEAGTPDLAPASLRPNPGLVHVAAATANLDSKGQPTQPYFGKELDYSKQQFAGNQADANEAAPAVGIPKSEWESSIKVELEKHGGVGTAKLLVFVHGYNTKPQKAHELAHRILQSEEDGGYGVEAVVSFSWDSRGEPLRYQTDEKLCESDECTDLLSGLVMQLLRIKLADGKKWQLVILAQSMGNRPAVLALGKVYKDSNAVRLVEKEAPLIIITAAADMDKSSYVDKMMPCMAAFGAKARATVLCSMLDYPLLASYYLHYRVGKQQRVGLLYKGAGHGGVRRAFLRFPLIVFGALRELVHNVIHRRPWNLKVANLDVIDCSNPSKERDSGFGHSYYLQSRRVRAEMIAAMDGTSAADRAGRDSANTDRAPARWANPYVPPADGQMYRIVA